jgi:hypothetical protein
MNPLFTKVKYEDYKKIFEDVELIETTWYSLLKPAYEELKNEELAVLILSTDDWIFFNLQGSKKFNGTQILLFQEYIKRVENFKITQEHLKRVMEEQTRFEEIKRKELLKKYREELSKDPRYTGIPPELEDTLIEAYIQIHKVLIHISHQVK